MWIPPSRHDIESPAATVNLGDWGNDQDVPAWLAWRISSAMELQAKVTTAVLHVAQMNATKDKQSADAMNRVTAEIVDDFCGTGPRPPWPWPFVVQQLGQLAERYPAESSLRSAALELGQRILTRAQERSKHSR